MTSSPNHPVRPRRRRVPVAAGVTALAVVGVSAAVEARAADVGREPVTVGLIEQTAGAFVTPEFGAAAEAMVASFNAKEGGVGGHPMRLETCTTDGTSSSATACAERFAADADVHLVIESTTFPAVIADVLTAAGKPLLAGGVDFGNMLRPGVFVMEPGTAGIAQALFTYAATDLGVTNFTVFHADDPAMEGIKPVIGLIGAHAGYSVDAFVPLGFEGDLAAAIAAGVAEGSDGLAFVVAPQQCAAVGAALQELAITLPVVVAELCLTEDVLAAGLADGWYAGVQSVAPIVNGGRETRSIARILDRYGHDVEPGGLAGLGVGYTWIAREVLLAAGGVAATDDAVLDVLAGFTSKDVLGFDRVSCPGPGPFVAACNASTLIVHVDEGEIHGVGGFVRTDLSIFGALLEP